jgi:F-type H+-transporting ATPase subunit b
VQARIANADQERNRIRVEAQQTAASVKEQIAARAQVEAAAARERGQHDIAAAQSQAGADLRSEIAALAMGAAEVVVSRNLDDATQTDLIEAYINNVGTQGVGA